MSTNRYQKVTNFYPSELAPMMDPMAQSFIVSEPSILTKIDLYFAAKDSNLPVNIEIRKMKDGFPGNFIVPFSQVSVPAASVSVSTTSATATTVTFTNPVYVEAGEYALCLNSDSLKYKVWISQLGEVDKLTGLVVQKQPTIGVLFKSQNSSTWTPDQLQDLKFTLYRAKFTVGQTASIDLWPSNLSGRLTVLDTDPLEVIPNSPEMKVYHINHGFISGSSVAISPIKLVNFGQSNIYGIQSNVISGTKQTVSNIRLNSYTVQLPQAVSNVTAKTRFGGEKLFAFNDIQFTTLYPSIGFISPSETSVVQKVKTMSNAYAMDSTFTTLEDDKDYEFPNLRSLPSTINRYYSLSNSSGIAFRIELNTTNAYVAPIVDTHKMGLVLVNNIVNNPTFDTENISRDIVTVSYGNTISFTNLTTSTGTINLANTNARANAVSINKGSIINIQGSNNNGNVRVLEIQNSGANILVYGTIVTELANAAANANIIVRNGIQYIAEEAAKGGSAASKYITRQINFINPCTAFKFFVDVAKPADTNLKFYYRTSLVGETADLNEKEFIEITGITIAQSLGGEFYEITKLVENIAQFDGLQFKIVLLSDNPARIPKCKNLRIVSLA